MVCFFFSSHIATCPEAGLAGISEISLATFTKSARWLPQAATVGMFAVRAYKYLLQKKYKYVLYRVQPISLKSVLLKMLPHRCLEKALSGKSQITIA